MDTQRAVRATPRHDGVKKLLLAIGGLISIGLAVEVINAVGNTAFAFPTLVGAAVGAYGLAGLVEIVSGVPFKTLANRWDSLAGWQRGIVGTLIAIFAFAAFTFVLILFLD